MDVTSILSNTIARLSSNQNYTVHPVAEIPMHHSTSSSTEREPAREQVESVVSELNNAASNVDRRVSFSYNEDTKRVVMRIVDPQTNELVRQIPSREMITLLERINDMSGTFVDEVR